MNLADHLAHDVANASALARQIGVSPSMLYQWRKGLRPVPAERCAAIERATQGAVTRRDLRPDDWAEIWPELKEPAHA